MSTEHRELRPFRSLPALDRFAEGIQLVVGRDRTVSANGWAYLDETDFLSVPITIQLADSTAALEEALEEIRLELVESPYELGDLSLVVVLSSSFLKQVEVAHVIDMSVLTPGKLLLSLTGPPRPATLRSPHAGCTIEASVCLSRRLARKPLQAWRRWTWLSRASFALKTERSFTNFLPRPLTDDDRRELGLPKGTLRYVTLAETSPLDAGVGGEAVEMWVDADVLAKMTATNKTPASVAMQRQLFLDAITAVVTAAGRVGGLHELRYEDLEDSLLGAVLRLAAGSGATSDQLNNLLEQVDVDAAKFLATIEDACGVRESIESLVGGQ